MDLPTPWFALYCTFQFFRRIFDFYVAVLASSGFHREQPTPMNIFKIAVRKFVSALRIRTVPLVDREMPLCIFAEAMQTDKLILLAC